MPYRKIKHLIGFFFRKLQSFRYRISGIEIGKNTFISLGAWLDERRGKIIIGSNCEITSGVKILSHDATAGRLSPGSKGEYTTKIGDNVFVGMNAVILPGIEIGDNVIVGAGAIVSKNVKANCLVVGNPGRVIKVFDSEKGLWGKLKN